MKRWKLAPSVSRAMARVFAMLAMNRPTASFPSRYSGGF